MYAASRTIRNRTDSSLQPNTIERTRKGNNNYCFVPFMWPALLVTIIGILLIGSGVLLCTAAYYGTHSTGNMTDSWGMVQFSALVYNGTTPANSIQTKLLIYFGPILMSFGVFSIVISCVIVCEARDAIIHIMETEKLENIVVRSPPSPSAENDDQLTPITADLEVGLHEEDFEDGKHCTDRTVICHTRKDSALLSQEFKFKQNKRFYSINNVSTSPAASVRIDERMTFEFLSTDKMMSSTKYTVTSWNSRCSCPFLAAEINSAS